MLADDGWKVDEDVKTSSGVIGQKNVGKSSDDCDGRKNGLSRGRVSFFKGKSKLKMELVDQGSASPLPELPYSNS